MMSLAWEMRSLSKGLCSSWDFCSVDIKSWATEGTFLRTLSLSLGSHHRKHFRELRRGAREHGGHDEVQQRHQFQEVVLQRSPCQQQAMLSLRGGREG